jgi:hypothetical protein
MQGPASTAPKHSTNLAGWKQLRESQYVLRQDIALTPYDGWGRWLAQGESRERLEARRHPAPGESDVADQR